MHAERRRATGDAYSTAVLEDQRLAKPAPIAGEELQSDQNLLSHTHS
jgi:hypothetical protein